MTEEEVNKILFEYQNYNQKYNEWWSNRDVNISKKIKLNELPDSLEKLVQTTDIELQLQDRFVKMIEARLQFYRFLQTLNFTDIVLKGSRSYKVSRVENGVVKSYDISL